ncbi:hypothetical protein HWV62_6429 [Athelia sp. TMB]|nr:hypothetical protein HWV62_6429 [Athelia sp. TMB]
MTINDDLGGVIRLPLNSPKLLGVANTRGTRGHQEDFYAFATLSLDPEELRISVKKNHGIDWDPTAVDEKVARQVMFVGIYDGHGGSAVAQYLRQELHGLLENVNKTHIPELFLWIKEIGGYFKRFRGGALAPWVDGTEGTPEMDLEARCTQAFFEVDRNLSMDKEAKACGATSSIVCPMTENHHADARVESARLRRMMGTALIADSFGETRWMGALANTRGLGDLHYKKFGVTPEPEVRTKLLTNQDWAYIVLVSDGVSSVVSDDEVVDLARNAKDPKEAADRILAYAEEMGSEDNATAIVVPLAGWGKIEGPDKTKDLREYRQRNASQYLLFLTQPCILIIVAVGSERQRRM